MAAAIGIGTVVAVPATAQVPKFEVDPTGPKQLPNNWIMGQVAGVAVDRHNHVWIYQRPRSNTADKLDDVDRRDGDRDDRTEVAVLHRCAVGDRLRPEGQRDTGVGRAGYIAQWPATEHGIRVDKQDNVWIGGNGAGDRDVLKFTNSGQLLLVIGKFGDTAPKNNQDTTRLGQVAMMDIAAVP